MGRSIWIDEKATWRSKISAALGRQGESWDDVEATTLTDDEMDAVFDSSFGIEEGLPFTLWTKARVYFPASYDGAEWVSSAPRNPCDEKVVHIGGDESRDDDRGL